METNVFRLKIRLINLSQMYHLTYLIKHDTEREPPIPNILFPTSIFQSSKLLAPIPPSSALNG